MAVENTNEEIVKKIQAGQDDFLDMLIRENMGLVNSLVSSMSAYNHLNEYDREELQQIGMIKIMEAAKQFNGSANTKFSTFAHIRIRYGLIDWLRDNKSMIHIPDEMRKKCSLYKEAIENFAKQNDGNIPSDRLLIKQLRMDIIEMNMRQFSNSSFRIDSCLEFLEAEIYFKSGFGYAYHIKRNYGYEEYSNTKTKVVNDNALFHTQK